MNGNYQNGELREAISCFLNGDNEGFVSHCRNAKRFELNYIQSAFREAGADINRASEFLSNKYSVCPQQINCEECLREEET